jgi:cell division septum initiation protein DivIVA
MENDVMELIETLYTMVSEAWGVPLGNDKCIIERDKALEILDEIKTGMPVELAEAKRLVSARDEFISNAKREAESVRKLAEEKARSMVEEQEVIRIARARSADMISSAQTKSDQLRRLAGKYADEVLKNAEDAATAAAAQVHTQRAAFRSAAGNLVQPAVPPAAPKQTKIETMSSKELD